MEELIIDNDFLLTSKNEIIKINCPYCRTGNLVVRQNSFKNNQFLGCSHYPICNQTFNNLEILEKTILCRSCKSGFMTKRKSKHGNFLGCTNYPDCTNTINLK
ncbi:topoisomerase DNA-binding C4 zinc finger domain-containing protein [Aestuariivivens sediminicola]|uniref:topoisomerase DNA-binding C4 zinc finger domain-containing protein n=1 Tax=Aestuariivivens sediminicola TaxID=2913560 RepID=UPI003BB5799F